MPHLYFMYPKRESIPPEKIKSLLTLPNIQYMVQGLDVFLRNNLDGDNRIKAIELRDGANVVLWSILKCRQMHTSRSFIQISN
jgi:hypothetical protein